MRRRDLPSLAGAPLVAFPGRAQGGVAVACVLDPLLPDPDPFNARSFRGGLAESRFADGRNVRTVETAASVSIPRRCSFSVPTK